MFAVRRMVTASSTTLRNGVRRAGFHVRAAESKNPDMFCYQCEQTQNQTGCTTVGVCGKTPDVAGLQDLLVDQCRGITQYTTAARTAAGLSDKNVNSFLLESLFSTLTNVNFSAERIADYIRTSVDVKKKAKDLYVQSKSKEAITGPATIEIKDTTHGALVQQSKLSSIHSRRQRLGDDYVGVQELITYGVKGAAAYAAHAQAFGKESDQVHGDIQGALAATANEKAKITDLLGVALNLGKANLDTMAMLDAAHTETFGHPVPTKVSRRPRPGKAVLISGHDILDTQRVLQQTAGKGVNVYTHGELLPAHSYPALQKFPHFAGHFGGAWQLQKFDFANFPGAILMTSNCLVEPRKSYKDRIFTTHSVGWSGVNHVPGPDFSKVIQAALAAPGFGPEVEKQKEEFFTVGFGRNAVLGVADKVISAVKAGQISRFFFVGGCDGSETERSYFTEIVKQAPKDAVFLTAGCGKYRLNNLNLGDIGGIPRVLDMGQCNDSYSAIQVAVALAKAFNTDVNGLPLSFAVSWFEQKAVAVLLTLLHLGVKNIHLGPNLPAFAGPTLAKVLTENFGLKPVNSSNPAADLKLMYAGK